MSIQEFKQNLLDLPKSQKLILGGSLLTAFSMLMPVYSDVSEWGKGVSYLGIKGPLSLIGLSIIIFSLLPLCTILQSKFNLKFQKIKFSIEKSSFISSLQSIFLLILMSSVYLDSEFGVNLSVKELRFGIIFSFIGAFINLFGFYLLKTKKTFEDFTKEVEENKNENYEPLMILPNQIQDRVFQRITYLKQEKLKKQMQERHEKPLTKDNYNLRLNF